MRGARGPTFALLLLGVACTGVACSEGAGPPTPSTASPTSGRVTPGPATSGPAQPTPQGTVPPPSLPPEDPDELLVSVDPEVMDERYAEGRPLFDYDATVPFDLERGIDPIRFDEATVHDLTFASPLGGRVPLFVSVPRGDGPFPAVILQHGLPGSRSNFLELARDLGENGVLSAMIDAPFARPENADRVAGPITFTPIDRDEQIQLIVDLRRVVDILQRREDVDPERIAYLGISFGGAMGGLFAGVEHRMAAVVLVVGDGGLVEHFSGAEDAGGPGLDEMPDERLQEWLAAMEPIEPLYFVGHAAPVPLLFQNGTTDEAVPPPDAARYQAAGSEPKETWWYEGGHFLPDPAECDRMTWLGERLEFDASAAFC